MQDGSGPTVGRLLAFEGRAPSSKQPSSLDLDGPGPHRYSDKHLSLESRAIIEQCSQPESGYKSRVDCKRCPKIPPTTHTNTASRGDPFRPAFQSPQADPTGRHTDGVSIVLGFCKLGAACWPCQYGFSGSGFRMRVRQNLWPFLPMAVHCIVVSANLQALRKPAV